MPHCSEIGHSCDDRELDLFLGIQGGLNCDSGLEAACFESRQYDGFPPCLELTHSVLPSPLMGEGVLKNATIPLTPSHQGGRTALSLRIDMPLYFWRSVNQYEVGFIIGDHVAVGVKASPRVSDGELKGLRMPSEEGPLDKKYVVSMETRTRRTDDDIVITSVSDFLDQLWDGSILS